MNSSVGLVLDNFCDLLELLLVLNLCVFHNIFTQLLKRYLLVLFIALFLLVLSWHRLIILLLILFRILNVVRLLKYIHVFWFLSLNFANHKTLFLLWWSYFNHFLNSKINMKKSVVDLFLWFDFWQLSWTFWTSITSLNWCLSQYTYSIPKLFSRRTLHCSAFVCCKLT